MIFQDTIDDLDSVIAELTAVRRTLVKAGASKHPTGAWWEVEASLRRASARADRRAATVRRIIELQAPPPSVEVA